LIRFFPHGVDVDANFRIAPFASGDTAGPPADGTVDARAAAIAAVAAITITL
jgi:hypothetical protein